MLAAGQTLVMLTGGIDLSVANTATAAAYAMAALGSQGTPTAVAVALAIGLAIGLINGIGIGVFGVQPLIMTLGMAGVIIGALTVASQSFINGAPLVPDAGAPARLGDDPGLCADQPAAVGAARPADLWVCAAVASGA